MNFLGFLIAVINFSVVVEVSHKLSPSDKFFVIDLSSLFAKLSSLIHFIFLNFYENFVKSENPLWVWNFDCIDINKLDNSFISSQSHDVLTPSQDAIIVLIKSLKDFLHYCNLGLK